MLTQGPQTDVKAKATNDNNTYMRSKKQVEKNVAGRLRLVNMAWGYQY